MKVYHRVWYGGICCALISHLCFNAKYESENISSLKKKIKIKASFKPITFIYRSQKPASWKIGGKKLNSQPAEKTFGFPTQPKITGKVTKKTLTNLNVNKKEIWLVLINGSAYVTDIQQKKMHIILQHITEKKCVCYRYTTEENTYYTSAYNRKEVLML